MVYSLLTSYHQTVLRHQRNRMIMVLLIFSKYEKKRLCYSEETKSDYLFSPLHDICILLFLSRVYILYGEKRLLPPRLFSLSVRSAYPVYIVRLNSRRTTVGRFDGRTGHTRLIGVKRRVL